MMKKIKLYIRGVLRDREIRLHKIDRLLFRNSLIEKENIRLCRYLANTKIAWSDAANKVLSLEKELEALKECQTTQH